MRYTLASLADAIGCSPLAPAVGEDLAATGITWDSRAVSPGDVYLALPGERVDGHLFIKQAFEAGAVAAVASKQPAEEQLEAAAACGGAIMVVPDVAAALVRLAGDWRRKLVGVVIALTGSSGKTTTKNLVRDVLAARGSTIATRGNQNNELGVPATLLRAEADTCHVVVEMGMRGLRQLEELCAFVQPDMALVTNVGTSHMELLGSRENIARAKAEPLAALRHGGTAFMNASDEYVHELRAFGDTARDGIEEVFFDGSGADPASYPADIRPAVFASQVELDEAGCPAFTLNTPAGSAPCRLQMGGMHNVHNATAAAAVGWKMGMSPAVVAAALEAAQPTAGRQRVLRTRAGITVVDDAYNANPDSMRASLDAFAAMAVPGRRFAVLGDMGELGAFSEEGHALVGRLAASLPIDHLYCIGPLSAGMALAAEQAGMPEGSVTHALDARDAVDALERQLQSGDAVLVKASHAMALERIVEGLAD